MNEGNGKFFRKYRCISKKNKLDWMANVPVCQVSDYIFPVLQEKYTESSQPKDIIEEGEAMSNKNEIPIKKQDTNHKGDKDWTRKYVVHSFAYIENFIQNYD